jgi:hypothetical protein
MDGFLQKKDVTKYAKTGDRNETPEPSTTAKTVNQLLDCG